MLYNIYDWTYHYSLKPGKYGYLCEETSGSYDHEYSKTEEETLQHVRSELYDIHEYDCKDPRTKIWIDECGKINCQVRYVDIWGFAVKLMQIEPVKEDAK